MGHVYVAEHPVLGRRLAVKVLRREFAANEALVGRFINEARAAAAIKHPNIIEVFDVGTLPDGLPYLTMEFLEGESLARRLQRRRPLGVEAACDIAIQAAAALGAAHAQEIVHRDLKPDNLFLVPDEASGGERIKVLDFGIAKLRRDLTDTSLLTNVGSLIGTPSYMSPEQCRGIASEIGHGTDIYSLGVILYEMLAGVPPFSSAGLGDLLVMHITEPPPPLRKLSPDVPPEIEGVVMHALQKDQSRRFATMEDFARALEKAHGTRPLAAEASVARDARAEDTLLVERPSRRSRRATTLGFATGERGGPVTPEEGRGSRRVKMAAAGLAVVAAAGLVALVGSADRSSAPDPLSTQGPRTAASSTMARPELPSPALSPPAPPAGDEISTSGAAEPSRSPALSLPPRRRARGAYGVRSRAPGDRGVVARQSSPPVAGPSVAPGRLGTRPAPPSLTPLESLVPPPSVSSSVTSPPALTDSAAHSTSVAAPSPQPSAKPAKRKLKTDKW
jgi:serine/threonine-protein kinase